MSRLAEDALAYHRKKRKGKFEIQTTKPLRNMQDLSLAYTPGVAVPCQAIYDSQENVYEYTTKGNTVAIVSDGTRVLGLGDIGPEAALPVMEGKAALFKKFADIDAIPLCIQRSSPEEVIQFVKAISPTFGAVNLEDIESPECFIIEESLQDVGIPVFHDDQHGTAIAILAGLENALKVVNKDRGAKIVVIGAGAAGIATIHLLHAYGFKHVLLVDSKGIVHSGRKDINGYKERAAQLTHGYEGTLADAMQNADVVVALSGKQNIVTEEMMKSMHKNPVVFALTNPNPDIDPELAKKWGAAVVATGRSDYPNQVNNALAFPGIFRGALDARAKSITLRMKLAAADAIASCVAKPTADKILPSIFEKGLAKKVAESVKKASE